MRLPVAGVRDLLAVRLGLGEGVHQVLAVAGRQREGQDARWGRSRTPAGRPAARPDRGASPFSSISTCTGEQSKPVAWKAIVCLMPRSSPRVPDAAHPHTRVVWLDGRIVDPAGPRLAIDDPGVRWGEGLFETMRAEGGRVPLLERHLDRLRASAAALGLDPDARPRRRCATAVAAALAAGDGGPGAGAPDA